MKTAVAPYVGIVVSGGHLDVGIDVDGLGWQASHDPSAVQLTADRMLVIQPALVLIECADSAAWPLMSELFAYHIPVALLDPSRVQELARSLRMATASEQLDGHALARLAQAAELQPVTLPPDTVQRLSAFVTRLRQLQEALETENYNRLNTPFSQRGAISERITRLQQELERLSNEIRSDFRAHVAPKLAASAGAAISPTADRAASRKDQLRGQTSRPTLHTVVFATLALGALGLAGFYFGQTFFWPPPPTTAHEVIDIVGSMNGFDRTEIHVRIGQPVTIRLTSMDNSLHTDGGGKHQWAVDDLGVNLIAPADGSNTVTFTPEKTGRFTFYCDICCGGRANPAMNGTLIVEG